MKNRTLMYSLVGLVVGGTLTGIPIANRIQAKTLGFRQTPSLLAQTQPQNLGEDIHHPQGSPRSSPTGMGMNQQQVDRHFIEMMIPHHQGAIDMANLALSTSKRPEVKQLAQDIIKAQNREIEEMKGWYKAWYGTEVPVAREINSSHAGSNHSMPMMNSPGMMAMMMGDLEALKTAPDFDRAFIEQMIPHHQMAVMMAAHILNSDRSEMRNLAREIIQTQTAEIQQMQQWYETWYSLSQVDEIQIWD